MGWKCKPSSVSGTLSSAAMTDCISNCFFFNPYKLNLLELCHFIEVQKKSSVGQLDEYRIVFSTSVETYWHPAV